MIHSKKADVNWWLIVMVIAIAGGLVGLVLTGKIWGASNAALPKCNDKVNQCACFYKTGTCPAGAYVGEDTEGKKCPADKAQCTAKNYVDLLSKTKKGEYGTCCIGRMKPISSTRFHDPKSAKS